MHYFMTEHFMSQYSFIVIKLNPKKEWKVGVAKALDMIYESKAGAFVINSLIKSKNKYSRCGGSEIRRLLI